MLEEKYICWGLTYITHTVKVGDIILVANQKPSPFIRLPMTNW